MSNLKDELSEYLSRNNRKNGISVSISMPEFNKLLPTFESEDREQLVTGGKYSYLCPSLTRIQRLIGFSVCLILSCIFFTLSAFYIPLLLLKARKFALLYTLGSTSFILSFIFLWGPVASFKHLLSREQRIFSLIFITSFCATLYFSIWLHSTPLTVLFAVIQSIALIRYLVTYIPGGTTGFSFFTRMFTSAVSSAASRTLPV